jgi:hypothetical protein
MNEEVSTTVISGDFTMIIPQWGILAMQIAGHKGRNLFRDPLMHGMNTDVTQNGFIF